MNACFKLITAVLGFAVAATSIGDVSAKPIAAKMVAKPHAATKTIARTPNRLHAGKRVATHVKIAHRAPKVVKTVGARKIIAAKPVAKKVVVRKVFGAKKIFFAKSFMKKSFVNKRLAGKAFAKKASTRKILAKRTLRGKTIAHASTKRPLPQKQAMLHRASVKKSVVR